MPNVECAALTRPEADRTAKIYRIALPILFIAGALLLFRHAHHSHELAEVQTTLDILLGDMDEYRLNHDGDFPPSLNSLISDMQIDPRLIQPLRGQTITYSPPKANDPDDTIILVFSTSGKKITVDKRLRRMSRPE